VRQHISGDVIRRWIAGYPWLIVLDGLDEVPASTNRDAVVSAIREFLLDATTENSDLLVVATSRPQGYGGEFSKASYDHWILDPLESSDALRYASNLATMRYGRGSERADAVYKRLERATHQESVSRLMQSPLQVAIMAQLVDRVGQPPQERYGLFSQYYNVIYSRELERNIPAARILREYRNDIDSIHWRVGLALQVRSEQAGRTEARLTRAEFRSLVIDRLREEEHEGESLDELASAITDAAALRLVFLVGHEADAIGFEIRSLQEFMAAEALHEGPEGIRQQRLRSIAGIGYWRNVTLFAAGRCFARDQALRDTIVLICQELNVADEGGPVAERLKLGSELALDILEDRSCARQPKYVRHLLTCALEGVSVLDDVTRIVDISVATGLTASVLSAVSGIGTYKAARVICALAAVGDDAAVQLLDTQLACGLLRPRDVIRAAIASDAYELLERRLAALMQSDEDCGNQIGLRMPPRTAPTLAASENPILVGLGELGTTGLNRKPGTLRVSVSIDPRSKLRKLLQRKSSYAHLRPVLDESSPLMGLKEIPGDALAWRSYRAIGQFVREKSLAAAAIVAEASPSVLPYMSDNLPWPLAALTRWHFDVGASIQPADVRDGKLGTVDAWIDAENRWSRDGITAIDIESALAWDGSRPLDPSIATEGFPLTLWNTMDAAYLRRGDQIFVATLDGMRRSAFPSPHRAYLANLLARWTGNSPFIEADPERAQIFVSCIRDLAAHSRHPVVSADAAQGSARLIGEDERALLFDDLGRNAVMLSSRRMDRASGHLPADIADSFIKHPWMAGHIMLLAKIADSFDFSGLRESRRELLDHASMHVDGELASGDFAILRLSLEGPTADVVAHLIDSVAARPALAAIAMDIMRVQGFHDEKHLQIILQLEARLEPEGRARFADRIRFTLAQLHSYHRSTLYAEDEVTRLGLPGVISSLAGT
jgi:hypothetical protein